MANRRMFALSVTGNGEFQSMPLSTQAIYFHLGMYADDDGFVGNPKQILRLLGGGDDEIRLLVAKGFIIPFNTGVCVIKHWRVHNNIQKDRYHETLYDDEMRTLSLDRQKRYVQRGNIVDTNCIQNVSVLDTEASLGKARQGECSQEPDEDVQAACVRYYEDSGVSLTFRHYDEIGDFLVDGVAPELIRFAADVAVENAAKSWKYAKAVITRWRDEGVRTLAAAQAEQETFRAKKKGTQEPTGRRLAFDE